MKTLKQILDFVAWPILAFGGVIAIFLALTWPPHAARADVIAGLSSGSGSDIVNATASVDSAGSATPAPVTGTGSAATPAPTSASQAPASAPLPTTVSGEVSLLSKFFHLSTLPALVILIVFFGLSYASVNIAWLRTDSHALIVSAILGGLAGMAQSIANGITPSLAMVLSAIGIAIGLGTRTDLPKVVTAKAVAKAAATGSPPPASA